MKLPENYQSWIEVANKCDKILHKYPHCDTIKITKDGIISEFRIDAVKVKAFDEIMGMVDFHRNDAMYLRDLSLTHRCRFEKINNITDLLVKLCQK